MEKLNIAVLGDSAMWGQGLNEKDKFYFLASQRIAQLIGKEASIEKNQFTARTGAKILAAVQSEIAKKVIIDPDIAIAFNIKIINVHDHRGTDVLLPSGKVFKVPKGDRAKFYDAYPFFFENDAQAMAFFSGDNEEPTRKLFREIPSTFPTVTYQVERIDDKLGEKIDLLLIDGSVNDIDIQQVLDSLEGPEIEKIDVAIKQYGFDELEKLLIKARDKFPNAVIILTGYFSPFSQSSDRGKLKEMAEYMSGKPEWQIGLNNFLTTTWGTLLTLGFFDIIGASKDVGKLVNESIQRSEFAHSRGLYWLRRVVSELYESNTAGPGLYFANPGFKPENSVFASKPFLHQGYKPPSEGSTDSHRVKDAALPTRNKEIPRVKLLEDLSEVRASLLLAVFGSTPLTKEKINKIKELRDKLDGPTSLINELKKVIEDPSDPSKLLSASKALNDEIGRIRYAQISSFVHPNEEGAERYADRIVALYNRHLNMGIRKDLARLVAGPGELSISGTLRRYGIDSKIGLRAAMQHMIIDSLAVEMDGNKKPAVFDPFNSLTNLTKVFINVGNGRRWKLNNPFGKLSTIDTFGEFHLGDIKQLVLEGENVSNFTFSEFTFLINGKPVFHASKKQTLRSGGKVSFGYPSPLKGLEFVPELLNFGSVFTGKSRVLAVKFINLTGRNVNISVPASGNSAFQWNVFNGTLKNGEEKNFQVTFRPRTSAFERGKLIVNGNFFGSPRSIGLLGKGPGGFPTP